MRSPTAYLSAGLDRVNQSLRFLRGFGGMSSGAGGAPTGNRNALPHGRPDRSAMQRARAGSRRFIQPRAAGSYSA